MDGREGYSSYILKTDRPVPIIHDISHHYTEGAHLWVGVEAGVLVVLNDKEQTIFEHLREGHTIRFLLNECYTQTYDAPRVRDLWEELSRVITKLARHGFIDGIEGYTDSKRIQPEKYARLHLTNRCQLKCIHCYAMSGPGITAENELHTQQWLKIIDGIAENGGESVLFTGGEPLLRPDCLELIMRAKSKGMETILFTNGFLVDKYLPQLKDTIDLIQVSLGSPEKESNDAIRGKGAYRKIIHAVDSLLNAQIPVRIGITVMKQNWAAIKTHFLNFTRQYAHTPLKFHLGHGLCDYGRAETLDNEMDWEEVRHGTMAMLEAINGKEELRITRKTEGCGYCEQLVVASDGIVYPCHLLNGALGFIDQRPLHQWHRLLKKIAHAHTVQHIKGCKQCDIRFLCGGSCRVINEKYTGSKFKTTCSPEEINIKYTNLVRMFSSEEESLQKRTNCSCEKNQRNSSHEHETNDKLNLSIKKGGEKKWVGI